MDNNKVTEPNGHKDNISPSANQPQIQFQIQNQPEQGLPPAVSQLLNSVKVNTEEGNASEAQVSSQIILIASAILAIVGVYALNSDIKQIPWETGSILLIAAIGLGSSLLAGVFHFASERKFWYKNREAGIFALDIIFKVSNPQDQNQAAQLAAEKLDVSSKRHAFWTQIICFAVGVVSLIVLVCAIIISKIK